MFELTYGLSIGGKHKPFWRFVKKSICKSRNAEIYKIGSISDRAAANDLLTYAGIYILIYQGKVIHFLVDRYPKTICELGDFFKDKGIRVYASTIRAYAFGIDFTAIPNDQLLYYDKFVFEGKEKVSNKLSDSELEEISEILNEGLPLLLIQAHKTNEGWYCCDLKIEVITDKSSWCRFQTKARADALRFSKYKNEIEAYDKIEKQWPILYRDEAKIAHWHKTKQKFQGTKEVLALREQIKEVIKDKFSSVLMSQKNEDMVSRCSAIQDKVLTIEEIFLKVLSFASLENLIYGVDPVRDCISEPVMRKVLEQSYNTLYTHAFADFEEFMRALQGTLSSEKGLMNL